MTKQAVLNSVQTNYTSRLFVFKAIDEHIKIQIPGVQWLNGVLISNNGIEMATYKLETNRAPLIMQVRNHSHCNQTNHSPPEKRCSRVIGFITSVECLFVMIHSRLLVFGVGCWPPNIILHCTILICMILSKCLFQQTCSLDDSNSNNNSKWNITILSCNKYFLKKEVKGVVCFW